MVPSTTPGSILPSPQERLKKKSPVLKRCVVGFMTFQHLVWYETDLVFLTVTVKEEGCRLRVTDTLHSYGLLQDTFICRKKHTNC